MASLLVAALRKMPRTAEVCENILGQTGVSDAIRAEALATLAKQRNVTPVGLLVDTINAVNAIDVSEPVRQQIFEGNAKRLLRLKVKS